MAVGMAELLRILPKENPDYPVIMEAYLKMMHTLKNYQDDKGMWLQLVDDSTMWEETSGTAMFTYAMIVGVKKGWLDKVEFGTVARKAWLALTGYINEKGDIENVCEGTNIGSSNEYYRNRLPLTGDLHGQAPVLWCAYALVTKEL
jgi:rhamnogalacturonyl hydrolase YesR